MSDVPLRQETIFPEFFVLPGKNIRNRHVKKVGPTAPVNQSQRPPPLPARAGGALVPFFAATMTSNRQWEAQQDDNVGGEDCRSPLQCKTVIIGEAHTLWREQLTCVVICSKRGRSIPPIGELSTSWGRPTMSTKCACKTGAGGGRTQLLHVSITIILTMNYASFFIFETENRTTPNSHRPRSSIDIPFAVGRRQPQRDQ